MSTPLARSEASILSPLRYPGAKRRLAGYVAEVLRLNSLRPKLFVEPFAGGASVALRVLNDNLVDSIALGDKDPLVASFWRVVFDPDGSEWLIHEIETTPVTTEKWDHFKANSFDSDRERALACIFLNRTSFSGILARNAGPIGGHTQTSQYKIDCRFSTQALVKRIRQAAALHKRVLFVDSANWADTVEKVQGLGHRRKQVFYYLDPPFYHKADRLYTHHFAPQDHQALHDRLAKLEQPWLLSYDPAEPIMTLYSKKNGTKPKHIELLYSAAGSRTPTGARELVITSLRRLPRETRLWRSSAEWEAKRVAARRAEPGTNGLSRMDGRPGMRPAQDH